MRALARRFATLSLWTLASRILGLLRDRYAGGLFGDSLALSAFYSAFQLPNLARNLFGEGALSLAFVPRYARLQARRPLVAAAFAGRVLVRLAVLLAALTLAGWVVAGVVWWLAGGRWGLVAALVLPQVPYVWFACVSAQLAGVLNAHGRFALPVASAVVFNVVFLAALHWGQSVAWLPWAVLAAGGLIFAWHAMAVWRLARPAAPVVLWRWRADRRYRDLRHSLGPTILAGGAQQIAVALESFLAMWLVVPTYAGAVTVLFFANRLMQFPAALIGNSTSVAVYPELARAHQVGGAAAQAPLLRTAGEQLAWWLVPASVGLIAVAEPTVRVVYQIGAFDEEAVRRTTACTQALAIGLLPLTWGRLLVRALHAAGDARTPLRLAVAVMVCQVVLGVGLVVTPLAEAGLALASAAGNMALAAGGWWLLRRRGAGAVLPSWRWLLILLASLAMLPAIFVVQYYWPVAAVHGTGARAVRLLAVVTAGGLVYLGLMRLFGWRRRA